MNTGQGKLIVVVGGQFGSEAKGHVAAWLARALSPDDLVLRVGGPNAGHTVVDRQTGKAYALRAIPTAAVTSRARLGIAAGSEVDPGVLWSEAQLLDEHGFMVSERLSVHPSATILAPDYARHEQTFALTERIGSTSKGVGAARADRIWRQATIVSDFAGLLPGARTMNDLDAAIVLAAGGTVLIEGTQGWGLGLHTSFYPRVTSGDCRAIDFIAQAGVNPWGARVETWVVIRPNPIRVAGNSGPLYGETSWDALGLPQELTTVTRKVRRVGMWDPALVKSALTANGWPHPSVRLALTMADHLDPEIAGTTDPRDVLDSVTVSRFIEMMRDQLGVKPDLVTTSPSTLVDLRPTWGLR